jgi:GT2 family glycosyltransferase
MPIAITGMHRSGTSMVAHALKLGGVYFGEDPDLFEPSRENPDGYWEHVRFVDLNDEILGRLDGGWERPPLVPSRFSDDARLRDLEPRAQSLVDEFRDQEPWAWKDPRNSLTIDLWSKVVPDLSVVVCLRNPLEVTLSLRRRAMFSYPNALELWETYYRRVLDATAQGRRLVTEYESYFSHPQKELRRLLDFGGVSATRSTMGSISDAINPDLRHSSFTVQDLLDAEVAPNIVELYLWLRHEAGLREPGTRRPQSKPPKPAHSGPIVDVGALEVTALRQRVKQLEAIVAVRELELGYVKDGRAAGERKAKLEQKRLKALLRERERELARHKAKDSEEPRRREAERQQAMLEAHERLADDMAELRTRLNDRLLPEVEALHGSVYDLRAEADPGKLEYRKLVRRIQEVVRENVPFDSTVLVASKGDDDLLSFYGRRAWHFPRTETGAYAGFYPNSDLSAIAQLEALRARGADHILFPATSLWWLDHYIGFRRHLEDRYRRVGSKDEDCTIYELRPIEADARDWRREFRELLEDYRLTFGSDPSVLDWNTGLDLASLLPEHTVFSPPEGNGLPYLDNTIDMVAVLLARARGAALEEADRVASGAVLVLSGGRANGYRLDARWTIERAEVPSVSIVVPCHNGLEVTRACLSSLRETLPRSFRGEIVVVDDASTDGTAEFLDELARTDDRLRVVRNARNSGFLESANGGAEIASGDVLLFLNNDTVLLPGWLEPILRVFAEHEDVGVVGGRLLYPDGRLQEAGALIFNDGSAWKYGYGEIDATAPAYSHFREVDYCSGCLLATKRSLFAEIGGFDALYKPGFYEDADYCFAVRERGLRAYYEPQSTIVHVEGATAGTDLRRGPKRHQALNQRKFVQKWREALSDQPARPETFEASTLTTLVAPQTESP